MNAPKPWAPSQSLVWNDINILVLLLLDKKKIQKHIFYYCLWELSNGIKFQLSTETAVWIMHHSWAVFPPLSHFPTSLLGVCLTLKINDCSEILRKHTILITLCAWRPAFSYTCNLTALVYMSHLLLLLSAPRLPQHHSVGHSEESTWPSCKYKQKACVGMNMCRLVYHQSLGLGPEGYMFLPLCPGQTALRCIS